MSSLQLDSSLHIIPEPQKLPEALVEKCAAISVRPNAIQDLVDAMQCMHVFLTCLIFAYWLQLVYCCRIRQNSPKQINLVLLINKND